MTPDQQLDDRPRRYAGLKLARWRTRLRAFFFTHTDFMIRKFEMQYVSEEEERRNRYDGFEILVLFLLVFHMAILALYDPLDTGSLRYTIVSYCNLVLACFFVFEVVLRLICFSSAVLTRDLWNVFDLLVILLALVTSVFDVSGTAIGSLGVLRTVRVFRPLRSVTTLPAVRNLVVSLISATRSLGDVVVLYVLFIVSLSLVGVSQFQGRLRTNCVHNDYVAYELWRAQPALRIGAAVNFTALWQLPEALVAASTRATWEPSVWEGLVLAARPLGDDLASDDSGDSSATVPVPSAARRSAWEPLSASNPTAYFNLAAYHNLSMRDFACAGSYEALYGLRTPLGCNDNTGCQLVRDNRILSGYVCPYEYSCLEASENPWWNFLGFDNILQAMLTLFICVGEEKWSDISYRLMDSFDSTAAYYLVFVLVIGAFFIVNLSIVLITISFEQSSAFQQHKVSKLLGRMLQRKAEEDAATAKSKMLTRSEELALRDAEEEEMRRLKDGGGDSGGGGADALSSRRKSRRASGKYGRRRSISYTLRTDEHGVVAMGATISSAEAPGGLLHLEERDFFGESTFDAAIDGGAAPPPGRRLRSPLSRRPRSETMISAVTTGSDDTGPPTNNNSERTFLDRIDVEKVMATDTAWDSRVERNSALKHMREIFRTWFERSYYSHVLNALIILNIGFMCAQYYGASRDLTSALNIANMVFTALFGLEFIFRFAHFGPRRYFRIPLNVFDFVILALSIVDVAAEGRIPSVSSFRSIRLLKLLKSFPGVLHWAIIILMSLKASGLLVITLFIFNYVFSMLGMQLFGGYFCNLATDQDARPDNSVSWCMNRPRANYDNVFSAMLATMQIMTTDNWDTVMLNGMRARGFVVCIVFVGYFAIAAYVLVNILVGILLSGPSPEEIERIGKVMFQTTVREFSGIDVEGGAQTRALSITDWSLEGFKAFEDPIALLDAPSKENEHTKRMPSATTADTGKRRGSAAMEDLAHRTATLVGAAAALPAAIIGRGVDILRIVEDTVTSVPQRIIDNLEAVEEHLLFETEIGAPSLVAARIAAERRTVRRRLREVLNSKIFENTLIGVIIVSSVGLGMETPLLAPATSQAYLLNIMDILTTVIFTLEWVISVYVYGLFSQNGYLRRDAWNYLDLFVVVVSWTGIIGNAAGRPRWLRLVTSLRAIRPLRVIKKSPGLRCVFNAFATSIIPLKNILLLALMIWMCFGLMGISLFMGSFHSCSDASLTSKSACLAPVNTSVALAASADWYFGYYGTEDGASSGGSPVEATAASSPSLSYRSAVALAVGMVACPASSNSSTTTALSSAATTTPSPTRTMTTDYRRRVSNGTVAAAESICRYAATVSLPLLQWVPPSWWWFAAIPDSDAARRAEARAVAAPAFEDAHSIEPTLTVDSVNWTFHATAAAALRAGYALSEASALADAAAAHLIVRQMIAAAAWIVNASVYLESDSLRAAALSDAARLLGRISATPSLASAAPPPESFALPPWAYNATAYTDPAVTAYPGGPLPSNTVQFFLDEFAGGVSAVTASTSTGAVAPEGVDELTVTDSSAGENDGATGSVAAPTLTKDSEEVTAWFDPTHFTTSLNLTAFWAPAVAVAGSRIWASRFNAAAAEVAQAVASLLIYDTAFTTSPSDEETPSSGGTYPLWNFTAEMSASRIASTIVNTATRAIELSSRRDGSAAASSSSGGGGSSNSSSSVNNSSSANNSSSSVINNTTTPVSNDSSAGWVGLAQSRVNWTVIVSGLQAAAAARVNASVSIRFDHWRSVPSPHQWLDEPLNFDHLGAAFLTLLDIASMDGWMGVLWDGIDSVGTDEAFRVNASPWSSIYFLAFVMIGGYFFVNLIVSVVIDSYNKEKMSGDGGVFLTTSQNAFIRAHRRLLLGVPIIFYDDNEVSDWRRRLRQILLKPWFSRCMIAVVFLNAALLLTDYYGAPGMLTQFIRNCNVAFSVIFVVEMVVKIGALGPRRFLHSRFNCFDLLITFLLVVGVIGELSLSDKGYSFIFRALRVISLFRVIRSAPRLRQVVRRFGYSMYGLWNVGAVLFVFMYVFSVLGMKLFGTVKWQATLNRQSSFDNLVRSFLTLLQCATGGGWIGFLRDAAIEAPNCNPDIGECGVPGISEFFFVVLIIVVRFVLLNLFIAVILDSFIATHFESLAITEAHVAQFFDLWFVYDPHRLLRIDARTLRPFLRGLPPDNPLGLGPLVSAERQSGQEFQFIQGLSLSEVDGSIELQDMIAALVENALGVPLPDSELDRLRQFADRKFRRRERMYHAHLRRTTLRALGQADEVTGYVPAAVGEPRPAIERVAAQMIESFWLNSRRWRGRGRFGVPSMYTGAKSMRGGSSATQRRGRQDQHTRATDLSQVDSETDEDNINPERRRLGCASYTRDANGEAVPLAAPAVAPSAQQPAAAQHRRQTAPPAAVVSTTAAAPQSAPGAALHIGQSGAWSEELQEFLRKSFEGAGGVTERELAERRLIRFRADTAMDATPTLDRATALSNAATSVRRDLQELLRQMREAERRRRRMQRQARRSARDMNSRILDADSDEEAMLEEARAAARVVVTAGMVDALYARDVELLDGRRAAAAAAADDTAAEPGHQTTDEAAGGGGGNGTIISILGAGSDAGNATVSPTSANPVAPSNSKATVVKRAAEELQKTARRGLLLPVEVTLPVEIMDRPTLPLETEVQLAARSTDVQDEIPPDHFSASRSSSRGPNAAPRVLGGPTPGEAFLSQWNEEVTRRARASVAAEEPVGGRRLDAVRILERRSVQRRRDELVEAEAVWQRTVALRRVGFPGTASPVNGAGAVPPSVQPFFRSRAADASMGPFLPSDGRGPSSASYSGSTDDALHAVAAITGAQTVRSTAPHTAFDESRRQAATAGPLAFTAGREALARVEEPWRPGSRSLQPVATFLSASDAAGGAKLVGAAATRMINLSAVPSRPHAQRLATRLAEEQRVFGSNDISRAERIGDADWAGGVHSPSGGSFLDEVSNPFAGVEYDLL